MAGPYDNMDVGFASQLQALIAASGGLLRPGSGYRDIQEQARLRVTNGCRDIWTAPASSCRVPTAIPGRSNHNHGLAMDLVDASTGKAVAAGSAADRWLAANQARFGMHRPVRGEAWHIEPIEGGGTDGAMRSAQRRGAIGFDITWQDEERNPEDELADRLRTFTQLLIGEEPVGTAEGIAEGVNYPEPPETDASGIIGESEQGMSFMGGQKAGPPKGAQPYNPKGGVEQWRGLVAQALQYVGQEPSEQNISMTLRRMQQESGGNPTIVNRWDVNAKRGDPSVGLMQVIGGTFRAHAGELAGRGQTDPFANLVASMRYALKRYGSLSSAYNRRGGY